PGTLPPPPAINAGRAMRRSGDRHQEPDPAKRRPLRAVIAGEPPDDFDPDDVVEDDEMPARWLTRRVRFLFWGGFGALTVGLMLALNNPSLPVPFLLVGLILLALFLIFRTTLDRYILGRFGIIWSGCALTFYTLFAVYELVNLLDDLVEHNLPFTLVLSYLKYRSPWIISQILPVSCLVATFMAVGIMSRFNEVTALKASGTSIYRIVAPVLIVTVAICAIAYVNQDYLEPHSNQRAAQVKHVIRGTSPRSYNA